MPQTPTAPSFAALLQSAVTEPGKIHSAYTAFHGYSLGNQILALMQCAERGITPGPIASFNRWKELGRHVCKGQKALELCMPVTVKPTTTDPASGDEDTATFTRFIYRRNWFVLAQTDGEPYVPPVLPGWDKDRALSALNAQETPFELMNGNVQGYARDRAVAVSPVAALPFKTLIHELAHVVLGHTTQAARQDDERTPRNLAEVEAESVAMLVCAALEQPGLEYSRGYIQHWYQGQEIPERNAQRIFKAADQILRAGRDEGGRDV